MDHKRSAQPSGFSLFISCLGLVLLLAACGVKPSEVDNVVSATLTAERAIQDSISTSVASTMVAIPTQSGAPVQPAEAATATSGVAAASDICPEPMADLRFLSAGYLEGNRFFISFEKASGFQADNPEAAYMVQIRGNDFLCSYPNANQLRIFCIGRYMPPVGDVTIALTTADSTCSYGMPFEQILIPPKPTPTKSGPYG